MKRIESMYINVVNPRTNMNTPSAHPRSVLVVLVLVVAVGATHGCNRSPGIFGCPGQVSIARKMWQRGGRGDDKSTICPKSLGKIP